MQRITASFYVENTIELKQQMLSWASRFGICCFMDSHNYSDKYHQYDCLVAVDTYKIFLPGSDTFYLLDKFYDEHTDWIFGHLSYDLKNEIEQLHSNHPAKTNFENLFFFIPGIVLALKENELTIYSLEKKPALIFDEIKAEKTFDNNHSSSKKNLQLNAAISKNEYKTTVEKLQEHILRGDCYEINYCQEFFFRRYFA